ncbi:unnamed protein product, partial [Brenthis ino]
MQANYPKKLPLTYWDPVHINYPVRKFPAFESSSETIGRQWRPPPEVLTGLKKHSSEENEYSRDYEVTNELTKSQTALDFTYKIPEITRFNKHTSGNQNYPPSKKLTDRTPAHTAHGTSEMKDSFTEPVSHSRLVTNKDQFKHPASLRLELPEVEPFENEIETIYTTHDGFEKYLDPYLTTNKLCHRPFTSEQLSRPSNTKDIFTYYTYSDTPWVRSPKPRIDEWRLPLSKFKSVYDKEKFKSEFREIRTHNQTHWVPRALLTETRDKYVQQTSRPESQIRNYEEEVRSYYQRSLGSLQTNIQQQDSSLKHFYKTESSSLGSGRLISSVIDQYVERNKRLNSKSAKSV